jgi:hypothetical protein
VLEEAHQVARRVAGAVVLDSTITAAEPMKQP